MRHCPPVKYLLGAGIAVLTLVTLLWRVSSHSDPPVFRTIRDAEKATVPTAADLPWGDRPVDRIGALHGLTEAKVVAKLGEPNQTYEFSVAAVADEFRSELLNTYPPGDSSCRGVRIKELQWKYREFRVAVWLHRVDGGWRVLDTCRWKKGIEF